MNPTPTNPQPSAAAMRAAKAWMIKPPHLTETQVERSPYTIALAHTIDRETGLDEVLAVLKEVEWDVDDICLSCDCTKQRGHHATCNLAALIARLDHNQEKGK